MAAPLRPKDEAVGKVELEALAQKRRRARSVAIALALGAIVLLFYAVTIAKLGPQVLNRPM
jgi:hypothetical protein